MERYLAVVGAGPVGSIAAAKLTSVGQKVIIVDTSAARCEQIRQHGLCVKGKQTLTVKPEAVLSSLRELKGRPLHTLILCTKTWSLKSVLPLLAEVLDPATLIINFQNGIGPEEEIARFFPRENLARAIVSYAGDVGPDGAVTMHWFTPPNYFGPLETVHLAEFELLARQLTDAGLTTQVLGCHEIKARVFYKTILNSALNALCANAGITMRQAMTFPHTRNLTRLLLSEGLSVAAAVGYNYGENAMDECIAYLEGGGDHLPSMWTDLQHGSRTEIEYINGQIARTGLMFKSVDVAVNLFFTAMIITQEIKSGARQPDDIPEYLKHF